MAISKDNKVTNKQCFNYLPGGHCAGLKDTEASCANCRFFKDKDDEKNNLQMDLFHRWENLTSWERTKLGY